MLKGKDSYSIAEQKLLLSAYKDLGKTEQETTLAAKLKARGVALR